MANGRPRDSCPRPSLGLLSQRGIASVLSLTEDLSEAIVNTEPGLEAGMAPGRYSYLRDNATGAFRLLAPGVARFADATANDSRIIFEDTTEEAPAGRARRSGVPTSMSGVRTVHRVKN